jgi:hypothetical protein
MSSIIKVDTIQNAAGTTGLTIDSNGVITNPAKPMFKAKGPDNVALSNNVLTKLQFNSTEIDVGNYFDTSNYRYVPQVAGKYFIYGKVYTTYGTVPMEYLEIQLQKNGSQEAAYYRYSNGSTEIYGSLTVSTIIDMNGSTDYLDLHIRVSVSTDAKYYTSSHFGEFSGYLIS